MPLTIKPPRRPGDPTPSSSTTSSPLQQRASITNATNTAAPEDYQREPSPPPPVYSPITPKALPAILAKLGTVQPPPEDVQEAATKAEDGGYRTSDQQQQQQQADGTPKMTMQPQSQSAIPPTEFMPQPPNLPFSSEDSSDAIALRAAISTLQFQKKKAHDDLRALEKIKKLALQDPQHFHSELTAGRVREEKKPGNGMQALLDRAGDEGQDTDDEDAQAETDAVPGAAQDPQTRQPTQQPPAPTDEIPNSQPSQPSLPSSSFSFPEQQPPPPPPLQPQPLTSREPYPPIPAPQNVVRTPHINWDKYAINPTGLDQMHYQQQRWPGDARYGSSDRGREFVVAAPYSPFEDPLEPRARQTDVGDGERRKDSRGVGRGGVEGGGGSGQLNRTPSATGTVSEHVMETRRGSGKG